MAGEESYVMPNYYKCVSDIYSSLSQYLKDADKNYTFPSDLYRDLRRYGEISTKELYIVIILSISMTLLRVVLTKAIFTVSNQFKPIFCLFMLMYGDSYRRLAVKLWP